MELIGNKTLPIIKANMNGKILYMNNSAMLIKRNLAIGASIYDLVDKNEVMKMSMYKRKMDIFKTSVAEYPYAIIRMGGDELCRTMTVFPLNNIGFDNQRINKTKRILDLYSDKNIFSVVTESSACENLKYIFEILNQKDAEKFGKINLNTESEFSIELPMSDFELLVLLTVSTLKCMSLKGEIQVTVRDKKIMFETEGRFCSIRTNLVTLCEQYNLDLSRALILESICEDRKIKYTLFHHMNKITLSYDLSATEKTRLVLKASDATREARIAMFIDTVFDIL